MKYFESVSGSCIAEGLLDLIWQNPDIWGANDADVVYLGVFWEFDNDASLVDTVDYNARTAIISIDDDTAVEENRTVTIDFYLENLM